MPSWAGFIATVCGLVGGWILATIRAKRDDAVKYTDMMHTQNDLLKEFGEFKQLVVDLKAKEERREGYEQALRDEIVRLREQKKP